MSDVMLFITNDLMPSRFTTVSRCEVLLLGGDNDSELKKIKDTQYSCSNVLGCFRSFGFVWMFFENLLVFLVDLFGFFWNVLFFFGFLWNFLECFGISELFECFGFLVDFFAFFLTVLEPFGLLWNC